MVRLCVLSGGRAGALFDSDVFPVVIGRNRDASLCLEDAGIWVRHLEIVLQKTDGLILNVNPEALATVNGLPAKQHPLRNGDVIQIGPARIQFWLSGTRQIALRPREFVTWLGLAALCAAEILLIYRFLR
jgi:pSer/pThr/pTyr-binding forkhead associated (FHA) protein